MSPAGERKSIARSTLFNLGGLVVPILVQLVTVPEYLKVIGADRYGIMALVWLLLGYFGVFDLGFGRAIASRIAGLASGSADARERVFWTGSCLSVVAGFLGGFVLLVVAGTLFGGQFKVPPALLGETLRALPLLVVALPMVTGISALSGALQGREAFAAINLSQMAGSILYQVLPLLIALTVSVSLPWLIASAIAGRFLTLAMMYVSCLKQVPAGLVPRFARSEIRPLFVFGSWVTLTGLVSPLLTVFDRFVIGSMVGMTAVAAYSIPYNLVMRMSGLPSALQNALFPRFAMVDSAEAQLLQQRAVQFVAALMTPALIVGLFIMHPFLALWIGPRLAEQAAPVGQILVMGLWPNTLAFTPFGFLQSRGRPDLPAKFHVFELLFYIPLLYFLTRDFGVTGAAWAWGLRTLVDAVLLFWAVDLLKSLARAGVGLIFILLGYLWALATFADPVLYWLGALAILALSSFWAVRHVPLDLRYSIMRRLPLGKLRLGAAR
jgi:O-antigen/teichoic acid export membrane protein